MGLTGAPPLRFPFVKGVSSDLGGLRHFCENLEKFPRGADYFEILGEYCAILIEFFRKVVPWRKSLR